MRSLYGVIRKRTTGITLLQACVYFLWAVALLGITVYLQAPKSIALALLGCAGGGALLLRAENSFYALLRQPVYWLPALFFIGYVLACWRAAPGTEAFWFRRILLAAQAIAIPLAMFAFRDLMVRRSRSMWLLLATMLLTSFLCVMVYWSQNVEAANQLLAVGKTLPLPFNHIRYNFVSAVVALVALQLATTSRGKLRIAAWLAWSTLAVGLHLLAVRTGIVLLYLGSGFYLLRYVWNRWGRTRAAVVMFVLFGTATAAVLAVEPLRIKLGYTLYTFTALKHGPSLNYSDGGRLASLQAGLNIVQDRPVLGAVNGDLFAALAPFFPDGNIIVPHNQWLYSWAAAGLPGLIGALGATCFLFFVPDFKNRPLLPEMQFMMLVAAGVEPNLNSDIGISSFLLLAYLMLAYSNYLYHGKGRN